MSMLWEWIKAGGKGGIAGSINEVMLGRRFMDVKGGMIRELSGMVPLQFRSDGSALLDWSITGAEGGVGRSGVNRLKQEEKSIDNMCGNASLRGNVNIEFYTNNNFLDIPDNNNNPSDYRQWLRVTYDKYIIDGQNHRLFVDDRPESFYYSQFRTRLKAGSYKLIFEGYSTSNGSTINWSGVPLTRYGTPYNRPNAPVVHLYTASQDNVINNTFDFSDWADVVMLNTIGTGTGGVDNGDGTWGDGWFTMTKNSNTGWLSTLSAYNTLTTQSSKIPTIPLQHDGNVNNYALRFHVDTSITDLHLETRIAKGTSKSYLHTAELTPDADGYITAYFSTNTETVSIGLAVNSQAYGVTEGDYITVSDIQIYKLGEGIANYRLDASAHTRDKFIHEELPFTLSEDDDVGVFFLGMNSFIWGCRFMIVDADVVSQPFEIGNISGVSCWEPTKYVLPVRVSCGGEAAEAVIELGASPLGAEDTITFAGKGTIIPTFGGRNKLTVDSETPPSEVYIKYKG